MKLWQIMGELQTIFSPKIAEDWDNVGLLVGDNTREINKILFCLDVTEKAVQKALDNNVDLIISHHPVIFSPSKFSLSIIKSFNPFIAKSEFV